MGIFDKLFGQKKSGSFPPIPKWRPDTPVDIEQIFEKVKYYTNSKVQFAIFNHGTVVHFSNRVDNIEHAAKTTLDKIFNYHPDMSPSNMDDGNYIINYSQPAFTVVFADEVEKHWSYIDKNHQDGVCRDEVLINSSGQHNIFDKMGKICLFGRAKMFLDAQDPKIAKTFDPTNV